MGVLVLGCIAFTSVIFGASMRQNRGVAWADDICSAASMLCGAPAWLIVPTILLALVYFYRLSLHA